MKIRVQADLAQPWLRLVAGAVGQGRSECALQAAELSLAERATGGRQVSKEGIETMK